MLTGATRTGQHLFHAAYDANYQELTAAVQVVARTLPHVGAIMASLDESIQQEQQRTSKRLLDAALLRDEWEPYLDELKRQGVAYADMRIPDDEWTALVVAFRPTMTRAMVQTYHTRPDDLCEALAAMDLFLDLCLDTLRGVYVSRVAELEDRLRQQNARNAAVLRGSLSAIVTMAVDGTITEFNPAAEVMFGHPAADVLGKDLAEVLIPPQHRAVHLAGMEDFVATGRTPSVVGTRREIVAQRADGTPFPAQLAVIQLAGVDPPQFTAFVQDLTGIHRTRAELTRSLEELQRSNRDLEHFAYVASHDLQEPLRMVASYTQLLARRYEGQLDERADKYIHYAVDGARRMQQLVNDLLTFSRVGTQGAALVPVEPTEVLQVVLRTLKPAMAEAGAVVQVGELPAVRADGGQLAQVFQNLISNAIKFRDGPPQIVVAGEVIGAMVRLVVSDDGIGIDPAHSGRLFQMFQRVHERGRYPGTGIGLALVKRIVERHGGEVGLESTPGVGTTVWFTLERAQPDPSEVP